MRLIGLVLAACGVIAAMPAWAQSAPTPYRCVVSHTIMGATMRIERVAAGDIATIGGFYSGSPAKDGLTGAVLGDPGTGSRKFILYFEKPYKSTRDDAAYVVRLSGKAGTRDIVLPLGSIPAADANWKEIDALYADEPSVEMAVILRKGRTAPDKDIGRYQLNLEALRLLDRAKPSLLRALDRAAAQPATGCSAEDGMEGQRVNYFDCSRKWTSDLGQFEMTETEAKWRRDLAGVQVRLDYGWGSAPIDRRPDRTDWGDMAVSPSPRLSVFFDAASLGRNWGADNQRDKDYRVVKQVEFGTIAIGDSETRRMLDYARFELYWSEWRTLLAQPGDVRIGAINTVTGQAVARTLPRGTIDLVLAEWTRGYTRLLADEVVPEDRCKPMSLEEHPEISADIVT